jgi:[ribosomal protein S5]-alanine N-acetyltransferase
MATRFEWQTPRLLIRRFREDDLEGFYELQGDPEATQFIGGPWTREKTRQTLDLIIANYAHKDLEWHAVVDRRDGTFLGICWLGPLGERWCKALGSGPHIEVGYRFVRRHWNKGYATEAGRAILAWGFQDLGLQEIVSIVDVKNVASDRVLQKLGLQFQRTFVHDGLTIKFYRLTKEQYRTRSE